MKKIIRFIISFLVTIILVYFLLSKIKVGDILDTIKKVSLPFLLIGSSLYMLANIIRALRFHYLLNKKLNMKELTPITLFYNFANTIFPFRLGELSYVYLLKKTKKTSYSHGLSTLIVSRIFDFTAYILMLFVAMLFSRNLPAQIKTITPIVLLFLGLLIIGLFFLISWNKPIVYVFNLFHGMAFRDKETGIKKNFYFLMNSFKEMGKGNTLISAFSLSICINFLLTAYTIFLIYGLNYKIPVDILFIMLCLSSISAAIPVSGIAGFGTTEGIVVLLLTMFGFNVGMAIVLSFSLHIIQICVMSALGLFGWIKVRKMLV